MVADEQTHVLPEDEAGLRKSGALLGLCDRRAFEAKLRRTFELVQGHYAALFKDAEDLGTETGSLVFTGGEDDPETLETLARMGFKRRKRDFGDDPRLAFRPLCRDAQRHGQGAPDRNHAALLLRWRAAASRPGLHRLRPFPRRASRRRAAFFAAQVQSGPARSDRHHPRHRAAPCRGVERPPEVLDAVLDPGFFGCACRAPSEIRAMIASVIPVGASLDEVVDRVRIIGQEQMFRIGVRILSETVSAVEAGAAFSIIAELLLQRLHGCRPAEMRMRHGGVAGGRSCVIAMGKLGGREMTALSDLDLILIYDTNRGRKIPTAQSR